MQKWKNSRSGIRWITALSFLCVLLLMLRGWHMRRSFPDFPISDPDTRGYLNPALCWLSGKGFLQTDGREWFYSAFLTAVLKYGGSFASISFCQGVIGILGTLLLWGAFTRWLALFADGDMWILLLGQILILPVTALYALNPNLIVFEKSIRPESMMVFFVLCYFLMLICFFDARWRHPRLLPAIVYGSAALFFSYMVYALKPSWTLSLPASTIPLFVGLLGKEKIAVRILPLIGGILLIALFMGASKLTGFQKESSANSYLPFTLVCIHSEQIVADGKRRLATLPPEQAKTLAAFTATLEKALIETRKHPYPFTVLGYNADDIMYRTDVFKTKYDPNWTPKDFLNFCYAAYFHAWMGEPAWMTKKIWLQLQLFLFPPDSDYYSFDNTNKKLSKNYAETISSHHAANYPLPPAIEPLFTAYMNGLDTVSKQGVVLKVPRILITLGALIAKLSLWIQIAFFIALAVTFRKATFPSRLSALFILSLAVCMYGYVMTIAIVHTLDMSRYRTPFAAFFTPILVMMLTYTLIAILRQLINRRSLRAQKP